MKCHACEAKPTYEVVVPDTLEPTYTCTAHLVRALDAIPRNVTFSVYGVLAHD